MAKSAKKQSGPRRVFVYKGGRGKKDPKTPWPVRVKAIITRYREVDEIDDVPAPELYEEAIIEYNEWVDKQHAAGNTKPKHFRYTNDEDDERLEEGWKLLPISCRDENASSRLWGIANGFLKMLNNPKNKKHKEAMALAEEFGIELDEVLVDKDGNVIEEDDTAATSEPGSGAEAEDSGREDDQEEMATTIDDSESMSEEFNG